MKTESVLAKVNPLAIYSSERDRSDNDYEAADQLVHVRANAQTRSDDVCGFRRGSLGDWDNCIYEGRLGSDGLALSFFCYGGYPGDRYLVRYVVDMAAIVGDSIDETVNNFVILFTGADPYPDFDRWYCGSPPADYDTLARDDEVRVYVKEFVRYMLASTKAADPNCPRLYLTWDMVPLNARRA